MSRAILPCSVISTSYNSANNPKQMYLRIDNFMDNSSIITGLYLIFIAMVFIVILFLIFREFLCWYWKINLNFKVLTEIRDLLRYQQVGISMPQAISANPLASTVAHEDISSTNSVLNMPTGSCPSCTRQIPLSAVECPRCKASFGIDSNWKVRPN